MTATARRIAPTTTVRRENPLARLREIAAEQSTRRFVAELIGDRTHRTTVNATDFADAAIAFLETCAVPNETPKIAVTDCETGLSLCFSLNLVTGEIKQS